MQVQPFQLSVNLPSVDDFAARYKQYWQFARGDGHFLFTLLVSPASFVRAQVATVDLDLPAVAGVAKTCYEAVQAQTGIEWSGFVKQFIGAVICCLMEANGFKKTGTKKAIPYHAFTKGEMYTQQDTDNQSN